MGDTDVDEQLKNDFADTYHILVRSPSSQGLLCTTLQHAGNPHHRPGPRGLSR